MLNIIIIYENTNTYDDIINYIKHINNINNNNIYINIYIINCNDNKILLDFDKKIINNINIFIYTYNINYTDSILNDIIQNTTYDYVLFTKLNIYLTYDFIDWIKINKIEENYFVRNNIFELEKLPDKFINLYDDNIYYDIINNISKIINENGINTIESTDFIESIEYSFYRFYSFYKFYSFYRFYRIYRFYIDSIEKEGFNIENNNSSLSYQYFILNLINKNYDMYILPFKISSYKLITKNRDNILINIENSFKCSTTFNAHVNYKIYNVLLNQEQSYIRDQIKSYRGYNPTKTVAENNFLKNQNKELTESNINYKNILNNNIIKVNYYFKNKWYRIYMKYNKLNKILINTKNKTISIFKLLNY